VQVFYGGMSVAYHIVNVRRLPYSECPSVRVFLFYVLFFSVSEDYCTFVCVKPVGFVFLQRNSRAF